MQNDAPELAMSPGCFYAIIAVIAVSVIGAVTVYFETESDPEGQEKVSG